jgi:hypothetical protein
MRRMGEWARRSVGRKSRCAEDVATDKRAYAPDLSRTVGLVAIENFRRPNVCRYAYPQGETTGTEQLKSGTVALRESATSSAHRDPPPLRFGAASLDVVLGLEIWPRRRPCEVGFSPHRALTCRHLSLRFLRSVEAILPLRLTA